MNDKDLFFELGIIYATACDLKQILDGITDKNTTSTKLKDFTDLTKAAHLAFSIEKALQSIHEAAIEGSK